MRKNDMMDILKRWVSLALMAAMLVVTAAPTAQARFLNPDNWDPWQEGVDFNRYGYAGNDPINKSDPNGHQGKGHNGGPPIDLEDPSDETDSTYRFPTMDIFDQGMSNSLKYLFEGAAGTMINAVNQRNQNIREDNLLNRTPRTAGSLGPLLGKRFEDAARKRYESGNPGRYDGASGNKRIADGINREKDTITEVKYVSYQGFTSQLKDMVAHAKTEGLTARLVVPRGTYLSRTLREAASRGDITIIRTGMRSNRSDNRESRRRR
jgi:hypothetical protein